MAAFAAITLLDGQATPVSHTFTPIGQTSDGTWVWEDQSPFSGSPVVPPVGFTRIMMNLGRTLAVQSPNSRNQKIQTSVTKVRVDVQHPTLEVLGVSDSGYTPQPTVAYITRARVEFFLPDRSTTLERKNVRKYLGTLLSSDGNVIAMVESFQNVW